MRVVWLTPLVLWHCAAQLHQRHGVHQAGRLPPRRQQAWPRHGASLRSPLHSAWCGIRHSPARLCRPLTCAHHAARCFAAWRPVVDAQVAGLRQQLLRGAGGAVARPGAAAARHRRGAGHRPGLPAARAALRRQPGGLFRRLRRGARQAVGAGRRVPPRQRRVHRLELVQSSPVSRSLAQSRRSRRKSRRVSSMRALQSGLAESRWASQRKRAHMSRVTTGRTGARRGAGSRRGADVWVWHRARQALRLDASHAARLHSSPQSGLGCAAGRACAAPRAAVNPTPSRASLLP